MNSHAVNRSRFEGMRHCYGKYLFLEYYWRLIESRQWNYIRQCLYVVHSESLTEATCILRSWARWHGNKSNVSFPHFGEPRLPRAFPFNSVTLHCLRERIKSSCVTAMEPCSTKYDKFHIRSCNESGNYIQVLQSAVWTIEVGDTLGQSDTCRSAHSNSIGLYWCRPACAFLCVRFCNWFGHITEILCANLCARIIGLS